MKIQSLVFAAALALPVSALAQPPTTNDKTPPTSTDKTTTADKDKGTPKTKLNDDEKKIVAHLHHVNMMEVDLGKQAKLKGTEAVKRYGEMLVKEHQTADKELTAMAKRHGIAKIPMDKPQTETDKAEAKQQTQDIAALKKLKGADFDRAYLQMMVDGHEKELAKSDVFLASAEDSELKTMLEARKTTLQRHADAARELQKGNAQASATPSSSSTSTGSPSTTTTTTTTTTTSSNTPKTTPKPTK